MVKRLAEQKLIAPLDRSLLPNLKHLSPEFQRPKYDPDGNYVVPYMWGTTGIGYNAKLVLDKPYSWRQFFDPAWLASLQKRVSILDDPREVIGAALRASGKSVNAIDKESLATAKAKILGQLPHISRIDSSSFKDLLASGDLWVAHGYSGDILRLQKDFPDIVYIIPEEGGAIWADNLAIPSSSAQKRLAHEFINFIMRPEINARLASYIHYATANEAAKKLVPKEQLENPNIYPSKAMQEKLEWFADLGEEADALDQLWSEIRSSTDAPAEGEDDNQAGAGNGVDPDAG